MARDFHLIIIPKQTLKYLKANRNVLVIEDDKIMSELIADVLDDIGFEVTTAQDAMTAFEKLQQQSIDFIILDILLPIIDGFEFYSKLQANPDTKNIPVMIVTAWADEKNINQASEMGIAHFLVKPFTEDELLREILALLRGN